MQKLDWDRLVLPYWCLGGFLFCFSWWVFCFVFNSSRVERVAFVHWKFVAFITSNLSDTIETPQLFFFLFPLRVLKQIFWVMPLIFNSVPFLLLLAVLVWLVKISLRCRDATGATAWGRAWSCSLFVSRIAQKVETASAGFFHSSSGKVCEVRGSAPPVWDPF